MDPKTEAQHRRELADALDVVAEKFQPLDAHTAEGYRGNAQVNRSIAEKLDPPQPEWRDGDLVHDRHGDLWQFGYGDWHLYGTTHSTESLTRHYGPLTRVLTYDPATQRIADPAKQEVVVSLAGIDRVALDRRASESEDDFTWPAARAGFRAAKAAREQLGEVQ